MNCLQVRWVNANVLALLWSPATDSMGAGAGRWNEGMMKYRRFGKTEIQMPVLTCGGMRYQQSWNDLKPSEVTDDSQSNLEETIAAAIAAGINHIETARGYGSSEEQLGRILPSLPRDEIIVQTKIGPNDSEDEFMKVFETSMNNLKLDRLDLFGVHGINTHDLLDKTLNCGTLKALRKLQDQGVIQSVGFSTHGPTDVIVRAIETDEFEYVNLHWYYFDQQNWPAIEAATQCDMGVFIISPSDKGGKLYEPPEKLVDLCSPLTPMGFNDLFCLSHPQVHTLSLGVSRASDFDAHLEIVPLLEKASETIAPVLARLEETWRASLGDVWVENWHKGLPTVEDTPGNIPLYHVLRMFNMYKAFDMLGYGKMRYNLLGGADHWFPGHKVDQVDWDALAGVLVDHPLADAIPDALREAHEAFNAKDEKRLSESE
jgi:predicted aldo/keto reductase-like oxidoreductase